MVFVLRCWPSPHVNHMIAFILYLLTGLVTAGLVLYNLSWGIWGASGSPLEYISLAGSAGLVGAALISRANRKRAGRIALCSMLMIWSFYAPAIIQSGRAVVTDRELIVKVVKWKSVPSDSLMNATTGSSILTSADLKLLSRANVRGTIWGESSTVTGQGEPAEVLLLIQYPVASKVDLPQPKSGTALYIQTEGGWRLWPINTETSKRVIRLEPHTADPTLPIPASEQARETRVSIERADGSVQGFGVNLEAAR